MPNYPTHARWGRIGAVVMALVVGGALFYLFEAATLAGAAALAAAAATFVGSIYPDIDHHSSVPRRKATRAFALLVVLGIGSLAVLAWDQLLSTVETSAQNAGVTLPAPAPVVAGSLVVLAAVVAAALVDPVIGLVTDKHRGWTHNALVNAVLTAALVGVLWVLTAGLVLSRRVAAVTVVGTFFVGALIHLGLDGEIL